MMYGKAEGQSFVQKCAKNPVDVGKDKIEVTENDCGKIVIQVNLSKESLHNAEISQIIREIFELSNHDVEVEKVVLPTGENTWQVRKMDGEKETVNPVLPPSVSMDLADKRRKISRMKLMKHNKLYKIKLPKNLSRSRQVSRRKLSDKLSGELALGQLDVSEVHSSPAITNLLSQLYPNPYNLISLLEVQNPTRCKGAVDASDSCKIRFKARDAFCKESDVEQELTVFTVNTADKRVESLYSGGMGEKKSTEKVVTVKKESAVESGLFKFTGQNQTKNNAEDLGNTEGRKVKRMTITSGTTLTGTITTNPSREDCPEIHGEDVTEATDRVKSVLTMSIECDNRKRSKTMESKITKKKVLKTANLTVEKTEGDKTKRIPVKVPPFTGEKVSISTIHPLSLQRTNLGAEENKEKINQQPTEKKPTNTKDLKAVLCPMTAKKKCVIQYLKLIKDMYEAEERCLQDKIDDAWNFALDQMEKPEKKPVKGVPTRKNHQTNTGKGQDCKFKHSQSQTPKLKKLSAGKKRSTPEVQQKREEPTEEKMLKDNPELTIPNIEFIQRKTVKVPEENTLLLRSATIEPSSSWLDNHHRTCQLGIFNNQSTDYRACHKKPTTIRTDTFVFRRKIPKNDHTNADGLPIEVINRNVLETNRKIDLLIKHIDNSMDWLSQSEKTEPSNISSLIEKAKDLSEKLEENLKTQKPVIIPLPESSKESWRLYENKNLSCNRSDLLLAPSYQSLHIFPVDRSIGGVHIRTGAFFNNDLMGNRPRDSVWFPSDNSLGNLMLPHSRSVNYLTSKRTENVVIPKGGLASGFKGRKVESEVPDLRTGTEPVLILVENSNELGSFAEDVRPREENRSLSTTRKSCLTGANGRSSGNIYRVGSGKSSLSISVIALDESSSALRPVIMQEITWGFPVPAPSPVTRMHYRNERHMVFTTLEASVLHVARATSFMNLSLMSVAQVVEQEPKQQSSIIISLHKCSSFVKNNDGLDESGKVCKFVVLPSDVNFTERTSFVWDEEGPGIKVLKRAESGRKERGRSDWDAFQSESSMEMYDGDKAGISKIDTLLNRSNKLDRYGKNLTWLHPLPDPYESNPADEGADTPGMTRTNFHAIRSDPQQSGVRSGEQELFTDKWVHRRLKFDGSAPPIFRYLSSETSNTSLDEKEGNTDARIKDDHNRKNSKFSNANIPLFPDINKTGDNNNTTAKQEGKIDDKHEDDDSSSTSSFKSSNDFSDVSEVPELNYPKKRPKSRSHFLDKLFHELRSFRKCLTRRRGPKRKNAQEDPNEFEDALSELNMDIQQENKVLVTEEKRTTDEAVAVNTMCIDEVGSHAMPRKIFKTSFRGKESVTELMIDLKDVSISEVSDISVEKRKLSTDHTKISIIISKQGGENSALCCRNQGYRKGERDLSREGSYHSLKDADKTNCIAWKKEVNKSDDDDDDDYKSADSGTQTESLENIPGTNMEEDTDFRAKMLIRDSLIDSRRRSKTFGRHKFDFYKKMENATSFDSLKLDGNELLFGKYDKEIAPLKKALADMQFRVHNIQKNTFCTSDEYYERALRMAKMSAGYCQSCKSKTVIPEDPLGIYQKLIPRTYLRSPYSKHRKYYFKTTSSTNSSFYSIHSSNSDVSDKFCHLNSSSSIVTNGMRSRGPVLRESANSNIPLFLGRTLHF